MHSAILLHLPWHCARSCTKHEVGIKCRRTIFMLKGVTMLPPARTIASVKPGSRPSMTSVPLARS